SVNVLARAHYLPFYSRYGPYDQAALDKYLWTSGENFEHWGHEASVMPIRLLPALRHRMDQLSSSGWAKHVRETIKKQDAGLVKRVQEIIKARGPITAADLVHLDPEAGRKRGPWWDASLTKLVLEYLFLTGRAATADRPNFQRLYGDPEQVWGKHHHEPNLSTKDARQQLFDQALAANWIGTVADLGDHYRIKVTPAKELADSTVERGLARWVEVEGWGQP